MNTSVPKRFPTNNLPFALKTPYFIGRDEILRDIDSSFEAEKGILLTQTIAGLGGVGKTQIALEYACRYAARYDCIWWFRAEKSEALFPDMLKFTEKMCGLNPMAATSDMVKEALRDFIAGYDNWLFIFDNAEDEKILSDYLAVNSIGQGRILITSRNEFWGRIGVKPVIIRKYSEHEALSYLRMRTGIEDDNGAAALAKELDYLPLALAHAAAYIAENSMSYEKYLVLFQNRKMELLQQGVPEDEATVDVTWRVSIDKINMESAKQLLYICSYYAPNDISIEHIKGNPYLPPPLKEDLTDELKAIKIVHELRRYSLVESDNDKINMHRLLQEAIKWIIKDEPVYINCCADYLKALMEDLDYSTAESRAMFNKVVPHAISICDNANGMDLESDTVHWLYFWIGYGFDEVAEFSEAVTYYEKSLEIREKVLGKDHPATATTYNNIALVYKTQGDYDRVLEFYNKALEICEKILGKEHPSTATTYNNIAGVYYTQGDYNRALEFHAKALSIKEKLLGKEHPSTATTYNNIALVHKAQGDYIHALEFYNKALVTKEDVLGKEHPDTATTYNNIANVYYEQCDYNRALEFYHKDLEICEKVLGKEHPSTATTYNNIASVYAEQGDCARALEFYHKALDIFKAKLGEQHPHTISALKSIWILENLQK